MSQVTAQRVDLYQPMINSRPGPAPVALRCGVTSDGGMTESGPMQTVTKIETYVLLSALPTDLQERVRTAIQLLISGR